MSAQETVAVGNQSSKVALRRIKKLLPQLLHFATGIAMIILGRTLVNVVKKK